ncbi:MAG: hypothetical protein HDS62_02795 [Bacteroidales bacterium]|nr:hypothetical protein [Bacteroidales bacterium]
MKRILSFILVMIAIALPSIAKESNENSSTQHVELEFRRTQNTPTILHAPMRINIDVYYNNEKEALEICYDGEAAGEVFLYLNENIIGYDSDINTSFQISSRGLYKIEIVGETWIANGFLQL